jgi:trigger factor
MNVTVEDLSSIRKKLTIEIAAERVATEIEKTYAKIAKSASIKGFRKGKVPRRLLEQQYAGRMGVDVAENLIKGSLYEAMLTHKVNPVSAPEIVDTAPVDAEKSFTYTAEVEIYPEVVASGYDGLNLEKEKVVFDESVVDARLQQLGESRTTLEVSSRKKAREGDTVILDFEGFIDGVAFANGSATDYQLELGSGSFIPGFEDQVAGMKRDEEREVAVTFPENYGAKELAGKPVVFKVVLKEIKEKLAPRLDDSFAKELGLGSLDELRERIREDSLRELTEKADGKLQEQMMDQLVAANSFDVPEVMIENQLQDLKENFSQRLKSQGLSLKMLGMDDAGFASSYRELAQKQVCGELILAAVAKQEGITVEEADLQQKFQVLAKQSNATPERVEAFFENPKAREGLRGQVLHEKVVAHILAKANVTEVEPEPVKAEAPEVVDVAASQED